MGKGSTHSSNSRCLEDRTSLSAGSAACSDGEIGQVHAQVDFRWDTRWREEHNRDVGVNLLSATWRWAHLEAHALGLSGHRGQVGR